MFTTLSSAPRPNSKPFDFRFVPVDVRRFQGNPVKRRRKRLNGPTCQDKASLRNQPFQHSLPPPDIGPHACPASTGNPKRALVAQATLSTSVQPCSAVGHVLTPSPPLLDECGHSGTLRKGFDRPGTRPLDASQSHLLSLPPTPTPSRICGGCSRPPVSDWAIRGNLRTHQESAEDLISYIPPTPTFAPSDRQASDKHASSMAGGPTPASKIDLRRGSTQADLRCHPDLAPADPDESPVEIPMTPIVLCST